MAIHTEESVQISAGFSKTIDEGAKNLMFDVLQRYQYTFPIKSTIREIVSNGLDSITEKVMARSILSGTSAVEDFFIQGEGDIYKDSRFDPTYYDPNYLSPTDEVIVEYFDGGELSKDRVVITDYGVGLGKSRLEGYFSLGWSSKRLNKVMLGRFGLGNKSPLSIGVPFYTVTSRWNGMEFCFNVYSHKVESLIPKFDTELSVENPTYQFSNGYVAYYKKTTEVNMLQIEISAKKHHKSQYLDAVTGQLLYFKNVRLFSIQSNERLEIPVKAEILYEDDMIVLSKNSAYSKPHLLLNGVNYGFINFQELELEEKLGNIGIKVDPESVEINPSRESLLWTDKTRETVVNRFREVVEIAQATINAELCETDFLKWLKICATASSEKWTSAGDSTVIGRLSKIVDMSKVELSYPINPEFRFNNKLMDGVRINRVELTFSREGSKVVKKVEYQGSWRSALTEGKPLLIIKGELSNRKNKYILSKVYTQGFVLLFLHDVPHDRLITAEDITNQNRIEEAIFGEFNTTKFIKAKQKIANLHNYILASKDIMWYESIEVPDNFKANNDSEEEEEIEVENVKEAIESAAERRKASGSTIVHTLRTAYNILINPNVPDGRKVFEMQKVEFPIHLVDTWNNEEIFWSNQDFEPLLHTVALITRPCEGLCTWNDLLKSEYSDWASKGYKQVNSHEFLRSPYLYDTAPVRLIKVAQNNVKYYKDFKHITKFFKEIKNKTITMSNALIRWNTARLLQEKLADLEFLNGFSSLSAEKHAQYIKLKKYVTDYWRSMTIGTNILGADDTTTGQLISHLDKVGQFQLFVKANPDDKESISQLALELFNPQPGVEIEDGKAIDTELYDLYLELIDWAQPVKTMLNMVSRLTKGMDLSAEEEEAIRHYFTYRGVPLINQAQ